MRHSSIIPNIQYAPLHIYRRQNNIQPIKLINYCYLEDIHRFFPPKKMMLNIKIVNFLFFLK